MHEALRDHLGLEDDQKLAQFMANLWQDYLGTANTELIGGRRLRPRYRAGIVSNSFVGAWEREQAAYGFEDLVEEIVYSHEAGFGEARSSHLRAHLHPPERSSRGDDLPR